MICDWAGKVFFARHIIFGLLIGLMKYAHFFASKLRPLASVCREHLQPPHREWANLREMALVNLRVRVVSCRAIRTSHVVLNGVGDEIYCVTVR